MAEKPRRCLLRLRSVLVSLLCFFFLLLDLALLLHPTPHALRSSLGIDARVSLLQNGELPPPNDTHLHASSLRQRSAFCECRASHAGNHFYVESSEPVPASFERGALSAGVEEYNGGFVANEFRGSMESELISVLPHLFFLHRNDKLIVTCSCGDMSPFYFFSENHITVERCVRNASYDKDITLYKYNPRISHSPPLKSWFPPPLKSSFCGCPNLWSGLPKHSNLVVLTNTFSQGQSWHVQHQKLAEPELLANVSSIFLEREFFVVFDTGSTKDSKSALKHLMKFRYHKRFKFMNELFKVHPSLTSDEVRVRVMSKSRCFVSFREQSAILASYFGGWNVVYAPNPVDRLARFLKHSHRLAGTRVDFSNSQAKFEALVLNMASSPHCMTD